MSGSPVVVLDIGASKVHCVVGESEAGDAKILGMGSSSCGGIRRSAVIDMPKVVEAIRCAVREAEHSAGLKITGAFVGAAGDGVAIHTSKSAVAISGSSDPIDESDVQRALAAAEQSAPPPEAAVLHRFVHSYAVDGEPVQNPLWLHGNKLEVETLSATASNHSCATLQRAVEGAGLDIAGFILESVAASWALLSSDEREMGVGILDIGAGTSDLAVYKGTLRHVGQIPFGSEDITKDLSVVLNISPREAEQLKREYGSVCCPAEEADEVVTFHTTAGRPHTIVRHQLSAIIEARQEEILEFVGRQLEESLAGDILAAGMIFTGGGALLDNIDQLGEEVLGVPVRIGTPHGIVSAESIDDPRHTVAVGLLQFATDIETSHAGSILPPAPESTGFLDKITRIFSFL